MRGNRTLTVVPLALECVMRNSPSCASAELQ